MEGTRRSFLKAAMTAAARQPHRIFLTQKEWRKPTAMRIRQCPQISRYESNRLNRFWSRKAWSISWCGCTYGLAGSGALIAIRGYHSAFNDDPVGLPVAVWRRNDGGNGRALRRDGLANRAAERASGIRASAFAMRRRYLDRARAILGISFHRRLDIGNWPSSH